MLRYQTIPRGVVADLAVVAARGDVMSAVCDAWSMGMIYGKRAERKRRKGKK